MILTIAAASLLACEGGTIDVRTSPDGGQPVQGVIDGEPFELVDGGTQTMLPSHYRFALALLNKETESCSEAPPELGFLRIHASLPLEVGTWSIDDPEIGSAGLSSVYAGEGGGGPAVEGWVRIEEFHNPWEDGLSWVTGALDVRARDGSWAVGRFEEIPLCYQQ